MKLIIVTGKDRFFGQTRKPWVSLDMNKFADALHSNGIDTEFSEFHRIANGLDVFRDSAVLYTFHQKANTRAFIHDVAEYMQSQGNTIIPSIELLRCHENKGYQELLKNRLGLNDLKSYYFSTIDEISSYEINFPIVVKTVDGSNGKGVFLCGDHDEIKQKLGKFTKLGFLERLDLFRRRYLRKEKVIKEYPEYTNYDDYVLYKNYITPEIRFIAQEFLHGQTCDYRVLAVAGKFFVMKRHARENDFRASGTKKFDMDFTADELLLNKAHSVSEKFADAPFLSMDFVFDAKSNDYKLVEFQGLHFGVSAIIKNRGYYAKNPSWNFVPKTASAEEELALGLVRYMKTRS